jgi:methionine-rich copper-binding protein CopC
MPATSPRAFSRCSAATIVFLLLLGLAPVSWAHARLIRSEPAKDAEISPAPNQLNLWFNELLEDGFNFVMVFPASQLAAKERTNLVHDKPRVDPADRTRLSVKLGPLPPGEYVVEWRVLSRDGHSAPGRFMFRVRAR